MHMEDRTTTCNGWRKTGIRLVGRCINQFEEDMRFIDWIVVLIISASLIVVMIRHSPLG
jgi:hypothetical protein